MKLRTLLFLMVFTPAFAQTGAQKMQSDRLGILMQEQKEISQNLAMAISDSSSAKNKPESEEKITRLKGDLQAINNEISRVAKETPVARTTQVKAVQRPAKKSLNDGSTELDQQPTENNPVVYEEWDVFKNFGKKGIKK